MRALASRLVRFAKRRVAHPPLVLRTASARDVAAVGRFLRGVGLASRRTRFHGHCDPSSPALAMRLCGVDGVRHQAWLAWAGRGDDAEVVGEARFVIADDGTAELAIAVADAWHGRGVADALMRRLLGASAAAGVRRLYGDVLEGNLRMMAFMDRHGFDADLFACGEVVRMACDPVARRGVLAGWFDGLGASRARRRASGIDTACQSV